MKRTHNKFCDFTITFNDESELLYGEWQKLNVYKKIWSKNPWNVKIKKSNFMILKKISKISIVFLKLFMNDERFCS
jgi:hypothetical protein